MNKKLLTMAVGAALAMGSVAAQADATWYGHLQMELAKIDTDIDTGNPANSVLDSENSEDASGIRSDDQKRGRLGVKVSEDLGGGLTGIAKFEWQVDTSDGDVNDGARETFVGLKGGFGTIQLGRLKSPYKYMGGVKYDAFVTTFAEARGTNGGMLGNDVQLNSVGVGTSDASNYFFQHGFWSDAISYQNKWGPVKLWVIYRLQDNDSSLEVTETEGDYQLGVMVGDKNWEVFGVIGHDELLEGFGWDDDTTMDQSKFGGKFSFKTGGLKHSIMAQAEAAVIEANCNINTTEGSGQFGSCDATVVTGETVAANTFLGYRLGMGKTEFVVQLGQQVQERDNENGVVDAADEDITRDYTAIGVIHKFSKKTRVFAAYRTTEEEHDELVPGAFDTNTDTTALTVGMRVTF